MHKYSRANFALDTLTLAPGGFDPELINQTLGQSLRTANSVTDALQNRNPMDVFADQADLIPSRLREGFLDTVSPYHAGRNLGRRLEAINTEGMGYGLPDITGGIKRGIDSGIETGGDILDTAIKGVRAKAGTMQKYISDLSNQQMPIPQELQAPGKGQLFVQRDSIPQELQAPSPAFNVTPPNTQALLGGAAAGSGVSAGLTALGNKVAKSKNTPLTDISSKFMRDSNARQAEFGLLPTVLDMAQVSIPSPQTMGRGLGKAASYLANSLDSIGVDDVVKAGAKTYSKVKAPVETAKKAYGMVKPAFQGNLAHAKAMLSTPGINLNDFNPLMRR